MNEDMLFAYFSGLLTQQEEKELLEWLEADEENKKILAEMAGWWAIFHVPFFRSEPYSPIKKQTVSRRLLLVSSKIAAAILILLIVGASSFFIGKNAQEKEDVPAYFETEVPFGSQTKVILPDQSVVWINAGSSVKYVDNTIDHTREVQLDGEAYFEVTYNPDKPFVVKTSNLNVNVLGTSFNVRSYSDESTIDVALLTGKVDVRFAGAVTSDKAELIPNQLLSFDKETKDVHMASIHSKDYCSWKDGTLKFTEQSFDRIARDLERIHNVQIKINSKQLLKEVFSGTFSIQHSVNEIFKEIDVDNKYTWTQNGRDFVISDKKRL